MKCSRCDGVGSFPFAVLKSGRMDCYICNGKGRVGFLVFITSRFFEIFMPSVRRGLT